MTTMSLQSLSLCIVSALLMVAVATDIRARRIPNTLVVYGAALGLAFQILAPADAALFPGTESGAVAALLGALAGLGLFLPLYVFRVMGAGDVKLVAMTGVWLGAQGVLHAVAWTLLAGGVLALAVAAHGGLLRQVGRNLLLIAGAGVLRTASQGFVASAPVQATGRLPYAVAIAIGTGVEMARLLSA